MLRTWVGMTLFFFAAFPGRQVARASGGAEQQAGSQQRAFLFNYSASLHLPPGARVRVWLPVASSDANQQVELLKRELPSAASSGAEPKYGNALCSFLTEVGGDGRVNLAMIYRVRRREVRASTGEIPDAATAALFLQPDVNVPIGGKPLSLLAGKALAGEPMKLARTLYDTVDDHMEYRKDQPGWGRGDAVWACDSKFGNCTDFHSLFISLARSNRIPAKFEIGFSLPSQRGKGPVAGYHCWAYFSPDRAAWVPVDISEANKHPELRDYYFGNLSADRIAFSTGRDLTLVPRQQGPPLNFMIFPYAEVDGKAVGQDQIEMKCTYEDVTP